MTSREIQARLAEALRVIDLFETALRYRDSLNRSLYEDEAEKALFDFRNRYPDGDRALT
jgi:hypothetical protein